MARGRQPSSPEEIACFDRQDRRLLDPVRDRPLTRQNSVMWYCPADSGKRSTRHENRPVRRRREIDADHLVVQDQHALAALGKDVDGHDHIAQSPPLLL